MPTAVEVGVDDGLGGAVAREGGRRTGACHSCRVDWWSRGGTACGWSYDVSCARSRRWAALLGLGESYGRRTIRLGSGRDLPARGGEQAARMSGDCSCPHTYWGRGGEVVERPASGLHNRALGSEQSAPGLRCGRLVAGNAPAPPAQVPARRNHDGRHLRRQQTSPKRTGVREPEAVRATGHVPAGREACAATSPPPPLPVEAPKGGAATSEVNHAMGKAALPRPAPAGPAIRSVPRVSLQGRAQRHQGDTPQLHFVAEGDPIITPEVAAVLARIVRSLRAKKGGTPV